MLTLYSSLYCRTVSTQSSVLTPGRIAVVCLVGSVVFLFFACQLLDFPGGLLPSCPEVGYTSLTMGLLMGFDAIIYCRKASSTAHSGRNRIRSLRSHLDPGRHPPRVITGRAGVGGPLEFSEDEQPGARRTEAEITKARDQFLLWLSQEGHVLGENGYREAIDNVKEAATGIPDRQMILRIFYFKDFIIYHGDETDSEEENWGAKISWPMSAQDGYILKWQYDQQQPGSERESWPLKKGDSYFLPVITQVIQQSFSKTISDYLNELLQSAKEGRADHQDIEIFAPYAESIQKRCPPEFYERLKQYWE